MTTTTRNGTDMAYVKDDGGRQDAGFRGDVGDCVARALAIVLELTYREVYDELNRRVQALPPGLRDASSKTKNQTARTGLFPSVYGPWLTELGWHWVSAPSQLAETALPPAGRAIWCRTSHLAAVVDGVVHDTWAPGERNLRTTGFWLPADEVAVTDHVDVDVEAAPVVLPVTWDWDDCSCPCSCLAGATDCAMRCDCPRDAKGKLLPPCIVCAKVWVTQMRADRERCPHYSWAPGDRGGAHLTDCRHRCAGPGRPGALEPEEEQVIPDPEPSAPADEPMFPIGAQLANMVLELAAAGMPARDIAPVLEMAMTQLGLVLVVDDLPPTRVQGEDGKTYPATAPDAKSRRVRTLELRAAGKSIRAIANELAVSVGTVHRDLAAKS